MNSRERLLTALDNKKPDCLPCQVHNFMEYYLKTYLGGADCFEAYDKLGLDQVIYVGPELRYNADTLRNWRYSRKITARDEAEGVTYFTDTFETPKGALTVKGAYNRFTSWETEPLVKTDADFELFRQYFPICSGADWSAVRAARDRIGDKGIVRGVNHNYGQPGTWQCLTMLLGTETAIFKAMDEPDWTHYALDCIAKINEEQIARMGKFEFDVVENGGGAASSTVISPAMYQEFCLPYDRRIHAALHDAGVKKIVYHLCGGLMPMLPLVVQNGADGLETMTPRSMGGDCDLKKAAQQVGDSLFFIGGFDQNQGFERGTKEYIRNSVRELFLSKPNGGYICSPSDHFFFGDPENIREFVRACRERVYE